MAAASAAFSRGCAPPASASEVIHSVAAIHKAGGAAAGVMRCLIRSSRPAPHLPAAAHEKGRRYNPMRSAFRAFFPGGYPYAKPARDNECHGHDSRFRQILHQGNADARLRRPEVYRTAGLSNLLCLRRTVIVSCLHRTEHAARRRKQKRRRHVAARDGCRSIRDVERARGLRRFDFRGARSPEVPARCPSSSFPDERCPHGADTVQKIRIIPDPAIVRPLFLAVRGPFRHPERPL